MANEDPGGTKPALRGNIEAYVFIGFIVLAFVILLIIPTQIEEPTLTFGRSFNEIPPTLFPNIAASGLLVLSALALLQSIQRGASNPFEGLTVKLASQLGTIMFILWIFALLFEPLGYWVSGILVSFVLSVYLGNRNIVTLAILCLGIPSAIYYVFTRLLLISLPEGILQF